MTAVIDTWRDPEDRGTVLLYMQLRARISVRRALDVLEKLDEEGLDEILNEAIPFLSGRTLGNLFAEAEALDHEQGGTA